MRCISFPAALSLVLLPGVGMGLPGAVHAQDATPAEADPVLLGWLAEKQVPDPPPAWAITPQTPPQSWDRFWILPWQYKTNARKQLDLYKQLHLSGWHIDRGRGRSGDARWATDNQMAYYVDHAAGKGWLHLTPRMGRDRLPDDGRLAARPVPLLAQKTIAELTAQLDQNLPEIASPMLLAVSLDDEISLGTFNSPQEVDAGPLSVAVYRRWLQAQYGSLDRLNAQWESDYRDWSEIEPSGFEAVREGHRRGNFPDWNLSRWIDWRSYMDSQFAAVLARLTQYAQQAGIEVPIGVVGGQQPAPFGGYDYAKLRHAVGWMEAYDIGGTNELLRSFWHEAPRRPIVQTYFARGQVTQDRWFLWYYLLHGNGGVIAWPDRGGQPWFRDGQIDPTIARLGPTFAEVQSEAFRIFSDPQATLQTDPIAILYSHPSVQASWVTDVVTHGKTWPRRSSSLDNQCQSAGKNRVAWAKLLEDCGFQARFVSADEVAAGVLQRDDFAVCILPRAMALSDRECEALARFTRGGGTLLADHWTAVLDPRGKGRPRGGLDGIFGIERDFGAGAFDGKRITEIDGEKYRRPFAERLADDAKRARSGLGIVELGTRDSEGKQSEIHTSYGAGTAVYLNHSPVAYYDSDFRTGASGEAWRAMLRRHLTAAGLGPRVELQVEGRPAVMVEALRWRRGDQQVVGVIGNPTRQAAIDGAGSAGVWPEKTQTLTLRVADPRVRGLRNLRTGEVTAGREVTIAAWHPSRGEAFALLLERVED